MPLFARHSERKNPGPWVRVKLRYQALVFLREPGYCACGKMAGNCWISTCAAPDCVKSARESTWRSALHRRSHLLVEFVMSFWGATVRRPLREGRLSRSNQLSTCPKHAQPILEVTDQSAGLEEIGWACFLDTSTVDWSENSRPFSKSLRTVAPAKAH